MWRSFVIKCWLEAFLDLLKLTFLFHTFKKNFGELSSLFIVDEDPEKDVPDYIKVCKVNTDRENLKMIKISCSY